MRSNTSAFIAVVALMIGLSAPATAAGDDATEARLRKLEASLQAVQAELAALKAERAIAASPQPAPAGYQDQIDKMVEKAVAEQTAKSNPGPSWVQNVQLFGDFRYRHEQTNDTSGTEQRDQNRIRARLGLKAILNEEMDAIFRIASGSSDTPVSTNQSLDESFSSKDIWLDWAYFDYHPASVPGLNVYGGKMKQPFYIVGDNELVWDGDISPEGIVGSYTFNLDPSNVATINGGGLWLDERAGDADSSMWGLQGLLRHNFNDEQYAIGGLSWYDMGNIEDRDVLSGLTGLNGNTDNGSGGYEYDYNMIEGFAEYGFALAGLPSAAYGSYVENTAADSGQNSGFLLGMRMNKMTKKVGSWQTFYNYAEVDPDAVFAGLSDSDFLLGGTGGKGHELGLQYMLQKNVSTNISYFLSERADRPGQEGGNVHVLHADLCFKF